MSLSSDNLREWDLPRLRECLLLKPPDQYQPYDVKFYPFASPHSEPIFAVVSTEHVNHFVLLMFE
jgi:hypothetical protein